MNFFSKTLLLLLLSNFAFSQDKFLAEAISKWKSASEYTQKVMEAMPQKHYGFKPVKDEMSFEEQLIHMANNMNWLGSKFLSNAPAPFPEKLIVAGKSRKEVVEILGKSSEYISTILGNFKVGELDVLVDFPAGQLSKRQIITLLNDHQTHHRAQLLVYLRLKGEKPPKYVGW
jgi:uncharacterized damage-inducible protein DinB